jgi:hypothetical protein
VSQILTLAAGRTAIEGPDLEGELGFFFVPHGILCNRCGIATVSTQCDASTDRQHTIKEGKALSAPNLAGNDPGPQEWEARFGKNLRIIALWGSVAAVAVLSTLVIWFVVRTSFETWQSIVQNHFLATMGLTGFGIVAFAVVFSPQYGRSIGV